MPAATGRVAYVGCGGLDSGSLALARLDQRCRADLVKVTADLGLCQGHQMCTGEAPDVFDFDEAADQVVLLQEHPDDSQRTQVAAAVQYCPAMALAMEED